MRRGTEQTLWLQTHCKGCWHEGGTGKQGKNPKRFLKRGQELCRKKYQPTEKGTRPRRKPVVTEKHVCYSANQRRLRIRSEQEQNCPFPCISQTLLSLSLPSLDGHPVYIPLFITAPESRHLQCLWIETGCG